MNLIKMNHILQYTITYLKRKKNNKFDSNINWKKNKKYN